MQDTTIYDIAGIGIGPFNLGLAALAEPIDQLSCIFFDARPMFDFHPGMLLEFAKMQVPFYADLVTGTDPTSRYSFLNYLKVHNRLYAFAILEDNYVSRQEYICYCRWVANQLNCLRFGHRVQDIAYCKERQLYTVRTICASGKLEFLAKRLVLGVGSQPFLPDCLAAFSGEKLFHSSTYLAKRALVLEAGEVVVIGAGQSAAEIVYDLLTQANGRQLTIHWITRSEGFQAMELSKLNQEMTSPDYIDYFYRLPSTVRAGRLRRQSSLYKGISQELITAIYSSLYQQSLTDPSRLSLRCQTVVEGIQAQGDRLLLDCRQTELRERFVIPADIVIAATGYRQTIPDFLAGIPERIRWCEEGYHVGRNYSVSNAPDEIFVQHADLHSHGFNAPDLGMGPYRNAVILNSILGYNHYAAEAGCVFQQFGVV